MTVARLLTLVSIVIFAVGCGSAGSVPILQNGDSVADAADDPDALVAGDGMPLDQNVVPPKDVVGEVSPECEAACSGKVCGDFDGCHCGTCPMQSYCNGDGTQCLGDADVGDPCELNCSDVECGEVGGCDCGGCDEGFECVDFFCLGECIMECTDPETGEGYECGDDGCNGQCGACAEDQVCQDHKCVAVEIPCDEQCSEAKAECGTLDSGCECGDCDEGFECTDFACTEIPPDCEALCLDLECGEVDGCDCGSCGANETCNQDFVCVCVPSCDGKECGSDGCGGNCGECDYGICTAGVCDCTSNCGDKECGTDGCGGSCGSCGADVCSWAGECIASCTANLVSFSDTVQKFNVMQMGLDGMDGHALDVDGDPNTCSPFGKCENGNDNSLGNLFDSIASFVDVNQQLDNAVANGSVIMLAELVGFVTNGLPFSLNMYIGTPVLPKGQCNFQTTKCNYLVESGAIDWAACMPLITFDNAKVLNNVLTAGGKGYQFELLLPFFSGQPMKLTLFNARIQATVVLDVQGKLTLADGVIGGAIDKQLLVSAVDEIPDGSLPVSKDMVKSLINMLITNDIDVDGDGTPDHASMGITFATIPGAITGVQ